MLLTFRPPYYIADEEYVDTADLPMGEIYDFLTNIALGWGYIRPMTPDTVGAVVLENRKAMLQSRVFEIDFTKLFDSDGMIQAYIVSDFRDNDAEQRISRFTALGRQLNMRFGLRTMEAVMNRVYFTYFPSMQVAPEDDTKRQEGLRLFVETYWPLVLFHHFIVDTASLLGTFSQK